MITEGQLDEYIEKRRVAPTKIASHAGWYRGRWETDVCGCGNHMRVPIGKKGTYRCNDCADRAEGFGD